MSGAEFGSWPRCVNGVLVEPLNGCVRIRGRDRPIELSVTEVRQLAGRAHTMRRHVLERAADEATRQAVELDGTEAL